MSHASNETCGTASDLGYARLFDDRAGELVETSHQALSCHELFDTFAAGVADALCADFVQLLEYDPKDRSFVLKAGRGFPEQPYGEARVPAGLLSQAGRAMLDPTGTPVKLEDFSKAHDWADDELSREHGARSGIVVKIETGTREFGTLGVFFRRARRFHPGEESFLVRAAGLLGSGIERLACGESAIAWRSRAEILHAGTELLRVPAQADVILSAAVLAAVSGGAGGSRPLADWCFADALEANGALPKLRRVAVDHAEGASEKLEEAFSAPLEPTAPHGAPRAYATREAELVKRTGPDFIYAVARNPGHRQVLEEARPCSYMCAPVFVRDRFHGALGFLRVETGTETPYKEEDREACVAFAALVGVAIDRSLPRLDIAEAPDAAHTNITPHEAAFNGPTEKEGEVLELIADGRSMKEIAPCLHISYSTVKTHRRHLCQKLGLNSNSPNVRIISEARHRGWLMA